MKRLILFFTILLVSICTWAGNVITYTATSKLSETTDTYSSGLHKNAFNVSIYSHTFSNGTGRITFSGEVTSIGDHAFFGCSGLTSVTIPNSVTSIGESAFHGCSGLTTITIPNSVTSIGKCAFYGCSGLTSITIPNSVTSIGEWAFGYCSGLTSVTIPNSVTSIGELAFGYCSGLTSITIPDGVTSIGRWAFEGCSGLTSVTIPNSVTSIGEGAFRSCSGLTTITIPNSVTSIGIGAFSYCSGLTSIVWNAQNFPSPSYSNSSPFYNIRSQITSFVIGDNVQNIPDYLCYGMSNLTSITIGISVTSIGSYAFYDCSGLTSITIPNSVTSIGSYAFCDCSGLTSITIPNRVKSIRDYAFHGCSSLTSVTIPNSVTSIREGAFRSCSGLTTITIPNSVTSIGERAFYNCSGLTSIVWNAQNFPSPSSSSGSPFYDIRSQITGFVIGDNVQSVPGYLCYGMSKLTSVTIGNSVTSIGSDAFRDCPGLTTIVWNAQNFQSPSSSSGSPFYGIRSQITNFVIGDNVQNVPNYLCYGMSKLTSITIPNSVTSIGYSAFYDCSILASVTIGNSVTSIGGSAFSGCFGLTSITIPNSVTSIGSSAFDHCFKLTSITIPNSVTSIGKWAFSGCSGLTSVVVESGNTIYDSRNNSNAIIETATNSLIIGCKNTIIPNSVTSIRERAFSYCSGLTSITIPNSVTSIGESAFSYCSGLTSIVWNAQNFQSPSSSSESPFYHIRSQITNFVIGDNVQNVPNYLCYDMSKLTSITIPNSVTSIGNNAFDGCSGLTSITCLATTPPRCFGGCFDNVEKNIPVYVPCYTALLYKQALQWKDFTNIQQIDGCADLEIIVMSSNDTLGSVIGSGEYAYMTNVVIEATPTAIAHFDHWSDGNTDNPRTLSLTKNTTITAIFEYNWCGENCYWGFDNGTLTIYGSGTMNDFTAETIPWDIVRAEVTTLVINDGITSIGEWAFYGCSNLTSITIPNSVTSIGDATFAGCSGLTSVTIPNSVTSIGEWAFYECSSLTSVTIPNSVTSIGEYAFYECTGLTSVHISDIASWCAMWFLTVSSNPLFYAKHLYLNGTEVTDLVIPNSVTTIGMFAFVECSGLTSITIPSSVTSIENYAFGGCSGLTSITCLATNPPSCYWGCFDNVEKNIPVFVPCSTALLYKQALQWKDFTNIQQIDGCADLEIIVMSSNETLGSVIGGGEYPFMTNVVIEATPTAIAHFDHWSDGNTDNPRTLSLTQDTTITAIFEYNWCGDNSYWGFDNGTLTIYGSGTMNDFTAETIPWDSVRAEITTLVINDGVTSIGDYAFYNCSNRAFNTLVLPHSIETIGDYAFANCSRLTSVTFGSELTEVGDYAFSGCSRISEMTCYAETTPDAYDNSFSGVNTAAYLYVPCDSKRAYTFDPYWGEFDIQCIGAETTTVTTSSVEVVPGDNEAVFTWPTDNNAASYSLVITQDGIVFCTLTFNANGQLTGIAFAPNRDGSAQAPTAVVSVAGMSFTVTGLNGATAYAFLFETKNAANQVIASYNGNFATTGYVKPTPTNVESVQKYANTPVKMVRDGQILIQRGDCFYNLRGQEVK